MRQPSDAPLTIALVDDHALIREAIFHLLSLEPTFKVQGVYASRQALLAGLPDNPVDLLVLDCQLAQGELDGIPLISLLHRDYPALRIVILSGRERPDTVNMCVRAGALAFVGKSQGSDQLLRAIRAADSGCLYLAPAMSLHLQALSCKHRMENQEVLQQLGPSDHPDLTPREREVLLCRLEGLSVGEIAIKLGRSHKTISGQKQAALRKLGIADDIELFKTQSRILHESA